MDEARQMLLDDAIRAAIDTDIENQHLWKAIGVLSTMLLIVSVALICAVAG